MFRPIPLISSEPNLIIIDFINIPFPATIFSTFSGNSEIKLLDNIQIKLLNNIKIKLLNNIEIELLNNIKIKSSNNILNNEIIE